MEKIFNQKNFNNFVWSPLGSRGNIYINFCLQVHFQVSAAWYCAHYLPPALLTLAANLPLVSTTQGKLVAKFATSGNLPLVSLTLVVQLDLRISPRIFEKIRNDPNVIIRGLGEGDSWKKPAAKNLVTLSL
jgi:hypothetical protein